MQSPSDSTRQQFWEEFPVRAANLDELFSPEFAAVRGQKADTEQATRRLASWCQSCAGGDWHLFALRLRRDGLEFEEVLARLASARRIEGSKVPAWCTEAPWILKALETPARPDTVFRFRQKNNAQPFDELVTGIVAEAEARVWAGVPEIRRHFMETGAASLAYPLVARLCVILAPILYSEFAVYRKALSADLLGESSNDRSLFLDFVEEIRTAGFFRIFSQKPVLLRLVSIVVVQWINTTQEFIERIETDLADVRKILLPERPSSLIHLVQGGVSDLHNSGHSVLIVHFTDGSRIVYKPRSLDLDVAWLQLIEILNRTHAPIDLKVPRAIAKADYGWSEYVENAECTGPEGFASFFRRAGAWLCIFHVFSGGDMHEENMIASGDHPVPVDLEMLLQPVEIGDNPSADRYAFETASRKIAETVLMTGLLPNYGKTPDHQIYGHGGLDDPTEQIDALIWRNVNTIWMEPYVERSKAVSQSNMPSYNGIRARLAEHIESLIEGFEQYARFLAALPQYTREELVSSLCGLRIRRILRPTKYYYLLLRRLKLERNLVDGAEWGGHLDFTARLANWDDPSDPLWTLYAAERRALADLNVPFFFSTTDGNSIADTYGHSVATKAHTGLSQAMRRINSLTPEEISWQRNIIRVSTTGLTRSDGTRGKPIQRRPHVREGSIKPLDAYELHHFADEIAHHIQQLSIRAMGGAAWIGLHWFGDSEVSQLSPLGGDFYNGVPGVALFFAAHYHVSRNPQSKMLALEALSSLRHDLSRTTAARFARGLGIGAGSGLGGIIYALTTIATLLNENKLLADAARTAELFTDELIEADTALDVLDGCAGAILGLLKFFRVSPNPYSLERAERCGEHLLSKLRIEGDFIGSATRQSKKRLLNGMSHGAAGLALGLGFLASETKRGDFGKLAAQLIEAENATFSLERENWPDFRSEQPRWPCQWCHGAAGIGLSRSRMLKFWDDVPDVHIDSAVLRTDLQRAVRTTCRIWPNEIDTLCCGTLGNIEFLSDAAHVLSDIHLKSIAENWLSAVLFDAKINNDFLWDIGNKDFNIGLFRGLAGAGYSVLRMASPDLPNVLVWE